MKKIIIFNASIEGGGVENLEIIANYLSKKTEKKNLFN